MIISNSEIDTLGTCERLHYYKFGLGLQPKKNNYPIRVGVAGHRVLETYYRAGLTSNDRREWYLAAVNELAVLMSSCRTEEDSDIMNLVSRRFQQYVTHYPIDNKEWRIVDVEGQYQIPLSSDITYGMRLDLLVEVMTGPWRGQFIVVDHKFCYAFQTPEEIQMNAQLPKYILTLRYNGFKISRGILNQIRYRDDIKDETKIFRRAPMKPNEIRMAAMMEEQLKSSIDVAKRLNMPVADYREQSRRHLSKFVCGFCQFQLPCSLELDGKDVEASRVLAMDYKESTYGYRNSPSLPTPLPSDFL